MEFSFLMMYISAILIVTFFTLLEHKTLASIQLRTGPNSQSFVGIFNSIADAIKLSQKDCKSEDSPMRMFMFPWSSFIIVLMMMTLMTNYFHHDLYKYGMLMFIFFNILLIYPFLIMTKTIASKYTVLSCLRASTQMLVYDMILMALMIFLLNMNMGTTMSVNFTGNLYLMGINLPALYCWLSVAFAETNRAPFDLMEGESELGAGFATEFSGLTFLLSALHEYLSMIIYMILACQMFISNDLMLTPLILTCLLYLYVWARSVAPRLSYDKMITMAWNETLPWSLALMTLSYMF